MLRVAAQHPEHAIEIAEALDSLGKDGQGIHAAFQGVFVPGKAKVSSMFALELGDEMLSAGLLRGLALASKEDYVPRDEDLETVKQILATKHDFVARLQKLDCKGDFMCEAQRSTHVLESFSNTNSITAATTGMVGLPREWQIDLAALVRRQATEIAADILRRPPAKAEPLGTLLQEYDRTLVSFCGQAIETQLQNELGTRLSGAVSFEDYVAVALAASKAKEEVCGQIFDAALAEKMSDARELCTLARRQAGLSEVEAYEKAMLSAQSDVEIAQVQAGLVDTLVLLGTPRLGLQVAISALAQTPTQELVDAAVKAERATHDDALFNKGTPPDVGGVCRTLIDAGDVTYAATCVRKVKEFDPQVASELVNHLLRSGVTLSQASLNIIPDPVAVVGGARCYNDQQGGELRPEWGHWNQETEVTVDDRADVRWRVDGDEGTGTKTLIEALERRGLRPVEVQKDGGKRLLGDSKLLVPKVSIDVPVIHVEERSVSHFALFEGAAEAPKTCLLAYAVNDCLTAARLGAFCDAPWALSMYLEQEDPAKLAAFKRVADETFTKIKPNVAGDVQELAIVYHQAMAAHGERPPSDTRSCDAPSSKWHTCQAEAWAAIGRGGFSKRWSKRCSVCFRR